ncbi:MAG: hypothetical protein WD598_14330 [Acidimicrobiia bacterium]
MSLFVQIHASLPIDEVLVSRNWAIRIHRITEDGRAMGLALTTPTDLENDELSLLYADVTHAVGDLTGDDEPELVLGYRSEGTGQILDLDIVGLDESGAVEVLAHAQLYKGTARIKKGTLVTWMPIYKKSDANCCPTWIRRDVVRYEEGAFVVHAGKKVPTAKANIPAGDL